MAQVYANVNAEEKVESTPGPLPTFPNSEVLWRYPGVLPVEEDKGGFRSHIRHRKMTLEKSCLH